MSDNKILNLCIFLLCVTAYRLTIQVLTSEETAFIVHLDYLGGRADLNFENLSYMGNRQKYVL